MFGSARIHRSGSIFERCVTIEDGPRQCWHLGADARALSFVGCWCTGLPGHLYRRQSGLWLIGKQPIRLPLYDRVALTGSSLDPRAVQHNDAAPAVMD
jgi:hypothetical protein